VKSFTNVHDTPASFAADKYPPLMAIDQAITAQLIAVESHR
jgi:hypothetical protein